MIPARLGSTRIARKNLRYLGKRPLVSWVTETARDSGLFDEVWINSESFELGVLAERLGVRFYLRPAELAVDSATSEDFVRDFILHNECDELYQITPTSPFLTIDDMKRAVSLLTYNETVLSVKKIQAECFLDAETPINFDPNRAMLPSQHLCPVYSMCNGIFGWKSQTFLDRGRSATYGRDRALLVLDGDSSIDIDTEADFTVAEAIVNKRERSVRHWSSTEHTESDASEVLLNDGVSSADLRVPEKVNIDQLLSEIPADGGARRVVERLSNCATMISQMPGEGNRKHYHHDWDEWWLILEGEYRYEIEGQSTLARKGDLISIKRGQWHQIKAVGDRRATRLAVSKREVDHVYHD